LLSNLSVNLQKGKEKVFEKIVACFSDQ